MKQLLFDVSRRAGITRAVDMAAIGWIILLRYCEVWRKSLFLILKGV
jgi:hypothetical protein